MNIHSLYYIVHCVSHVTAPSLVGVDYCYRANDMLQDSDNLREFVNFLLAFRVCDLSTVFILYALFYVVVIRGVLCSCICDDLYFV